MLSILEYLCLYATKHPLSKYPRMKKLMQLNNSVKIECLFLNELEGNIESINN